MHGCYTENGIKETPIIAKVDDHVLTLNELQKAIPNNLSSIDSTAFSQNFINQWVKSALLLRKAELNLSPEEKDVEQILENYRASLLIHKYQQKLLLQKYSPLITSSEIEEYYDQMKENFILEDDIIQGVFVRVPLNTPNLNQLQKWYRSTKSEDYVKLEEYCYQYAQQFENFLDKWITVKEISDFLPKPLPTQTNFLNTNTYHETMDSVSRYLISFSDYHKVGEIAPLSHVEDKIKAILLNKKRIEFIKNLEEELYQEGLKQKIIKFY
jgi:hypothetical protein